MLLHFFLKPYLKIHTDSDKDNEARIAIIDIQNPTIRRETLYEIRKIYMSVLEAVKKGTSSQTRGRLRDAGSSVAREAALHVAYFVSGLLVSKGAMLGSLSPFGASFSAAVPFPYMPAGMLGAGLGYLLMNPLDSFRYIAIIISIGALRWVLNEIKKISENRFFPSVVAFVPVFATGLALTFTSASEITDMSSCLVEAVLAAAGAYFMSRTAALSERGRGIYTFSPREIACLAMTGCILILAFGSLSVGGISAGRILAVLVILIAARYGSVSGGSIAGIATGIVFSLADADMLFLSAGFSFSGLMGGLFAPVGKLAVALTALVCNAIMSLTTGDKTLVLSVMIETLIAGTVFMLLPKELGNFMTSVFSEKPENTENVVRRNVTMRLSHCSKALENVSSCVNSVSDKLGKLYTPNAWWIYDKASDAVCTNCGLRVYCWEKQKELTVDDFHRLTDTLKRNGYVKERDIEENFLKRCCKTSELANAVNQSYKDYRSLEAANRRVTQIRSVVAGQFSGLSDILQDLSEEFESCESFDADAARRVIESLSSLGLTVVDCSVRKSLGRGTTVELEIVVGKKTALSKSQLTREVSKACGGYFDSPTISFEGGRARICLCERPLYDVEIGSAQHVCGGGDLCGDCLNYFNNGEGSTVAVISDGMGTGGRAAVDSNMAVSIMTKLLKAGLSYDCALAVVNSSLMVKSEDESMATLDVLDFNLFTGKAELMKAGACTTYVKKNSKLLKKEMPSLPVGILNEVKFSKEAVTLSSGDFILMVSDGALTGNEEWLERMVMTFREGSAQDLATHVVDEAEKRRKNDRDDDITALAFKIIENV